MIAVRGWKLRSAYGACRRSWFAAFGARRCRTGLSNLLCAVQSNRQSGRDIFPHASLIRGPRTASGNTTTRCGSKAVGRQMIAGSTRIMATLVISKVTTVRRAARRWLSSQPENHQRSTRTLTTGGAQIGAGHPRNPRRSPSRRPARTQRPSRWPPGWQPVCPGGARRTRAALPSSGEPSPTAAFGRRTASCPRAFQTGHSRASRCPTVHRPFPAPSPARGGCRPAYRPPFRALRSLLSGQKSAVSVARETRRSTARYTSRAARRRWPGSQSSSTSSVQALRRPRVVSRIAMSRSRRRRLPRSPLAGGVRQVSDANEGIDARLAPRASLRKASRWTIHRSPIRGRGLP